MNDATSSKRRGVVRQPRAEAHDCRRARAERPGHDHQAEHEQRVDQDRAQDGGLGDDLLSRLKGEDHHEELGQVADRRLHQTPVAAGPSRSPTCSVASATDPGHAGQRERGNQEGDHPGDAVGVPRHAREHGHRGDRGEDRAFGSGEPAQLLVCCSGCVPPANPPARTRRSRPRAVPARRSRARWCRDRRSAVSRARRFLNFRISST